jgi:hypothetical protein
VAIPKHVVMADVDDADSSNVRQIGYDHQAQNIWIRLHQGRIYCAYGPSFTEFRAFLHAKSAGKHYHAVIKKNFTVKEA